MSLFKDRNIHEMPRLKQFSHWPLNREAQVSSLAGP
jgi:hypothetical protein